MSLGLRSITSIHILQKASQKISRGRFTNFWTMRNLLYLKAIDFTHGHVKHHDTPYFHTCPSTMKDLEHKTKNEKSKVVYKKLVVSMNTSSELVPVTTPRNMQQVRSIRHRVLQQSCILHYDVYNLYEIAYDVRGYILVLF